MKFKVNAKAPFDCYHTRAGKFLKGVEYDSEELRLAPEQLEYLRVLNLKGLRIIEEISAVDNKG